MSPRKSVDALLMFADEIPGYREPLEVFGIERRLPIRHGEPGVRLAPRTLRVRRSAASAVVATAY